MGATARSSDCAKRKGLEIHDIGPPMQDGALAQRLAQEGVVAHGKLSAEEVSRALSGAAYGALSYPTDYVSKSGVFAAYSAHGMCPILLWQDYRPHDGLDGQRPLRWPVSTRWSSRHRFALRRPPGAPMV